jgi:transcription elongation GreA/GreB family factor
MPDRHFQRSGYDPFSEQDDCRRLIAIVHPETMMRILILATAVVGILLLSGFRTVRVRVKPDPAVIQAKVGPGDIVTIHTKDDREFRLEVMQVTSKALVSKRVLEEKVTIPFEQINTIEIDVYKKRRETLKPDPAVIQAKVGAGDTVIIRTQDGKKVRWQVTDVTSEGVKGKRVSRGRNVWISLIPFAEIKAIRFVYKKERETVLPDPALVQEKVDAGDTVTIRTYDGEKARLRVGKVSSKGLGGVSISEEEKGVTIPFEQIKTIKRDTYKAWRGLPGPGNAWLVAFVVVLLMLSAL